MECTGERAIEGQSSARTMADHLERYRFAQQFVEGKDVLDIACGSGYGTALLAEGGARSVVGMDLSSAAIEHAEKNHASSRSRFVREISKHCISLLHLMSSSHSKPLNMCRNTCKPSTHFSRHCAPMEP